MVGQTISHYKIDGVLGSGGMGVVYKAEDTSLGRTVALKLLAPHLVGSEEHKLRLLREAKAAAALDHPNICVVHEVGEADGHVYLALSYVDGPEVAARIKERPLKLDEVHDIAIQTAEGLRAAHRQGIVHRDIKSSNLMLTSTGQLKIMDFGLAQFAGHTRITKTDTVAGTPAYMSPEQAQGLPADRRSDIWSLGVVMYEMLTGRLPFEAEREQAVIHAIITSTPEPVTARRAGLPLDLDRIIGKALAKDPVQRYQHIDDMLVDLRAIRANTALPHPPSRRWMAAAALPLVIGAGYVAWKASRAPETSPVLRAVPLTTLTGVQRSPTLSPDGSQVAFTWTGLNQDNPDIYVQMIGSGAPLRRTTDPANDYNAVWSPDGRSIAFLRRQANSQVSEVRLIPPLGGPERKVTEIRVRDGFSVIPPYLTWCPDGSCLVSTDSPGEGKLDALFVISLETGEKRQLTFPQPPSGGDTNPAVSAEGDWLVFRRPAGGMYTGLLYGQRLGKGMTAVGKTQRLTEFGLDPSFPAWIPGTREILFSGRFGLWRLPVPGPGAPARVPFVGEDGVMPAISPAQTNRPSRLVYVRSFMDFNVWRIDTKEPGFPASSAPAAAIKSTRLEDMAQLSPDGKRVAFTSDRTGGWEIWVSDPEGGNAVQLTSMGAVAAGYPHWSPDSEEIVFHSNVEGQWDVFTIPAAGGKPRNLTSHPARDYFPSYSSNGQWIYFNSTRGGGEIRIWKIPSGGGDPVRVTSIDGEGPQDSPDGASLYFVESIEGSSALWRMPASGGDPVKVLGGVFMVNFAVLHKGVYFVSQVSGGGGTHYHDRPAGETQLQYFDFATRKTITVARNLGAVDVPISTSKDGRTIFFSRADSSVDDLMLVENFR